MDSSKQNLNSTNSQKSSKKTENFLILFAVLLLLLSATALYFDDWLWSGLRSRSDSIGMITSSSGDVRLKFDQEVSWMKARSGQSLQYNDSIFAGQESEAKLKLGESQLTVTQNSLVVLRREMDANFLNLNFGTVFGKVAKNEKVFIDTGAGKPTLLKTTSDAQIVLKKNGNKTSLEVVKGVAEIEIDGVKKSIGENTQLELPSKPEEKLVERKLDIKILPPSPNGDIYSKEAQELSFKWKYGDSTLVSASDRFEVEFSKDSQFSTSLKKPAQGKSELSLNVTQSNQLFYRVRGPRGELSPTYRFRFVRVLTPKIIKPAQDQLFETSYRKPKVVGFQVVTGPLQPKLWTQVAADPEFKTVLLNESREDTSWEKPLPGGEYYFRARSDYGENRLSDWSQASFFKVKEGFPPTRLPVANLDREVIIANQPYPDQMYKASDETVKSYLHENGFLKDYFSSMKPSYDQLSLDFGGGEIQKVTDSSFPKDKIYPSRIRYRYQLQKAGQLPSRWSPVETLRVTLEPPKHNSTEVVRDEIKNDGKVPVEVNFTPLLFAKDYDFQVATHPSFARSQSVRGSAHQRKMKLTLGKDYYWRVRALNASGQPISAYSGARRISSRELLHQVRLAQQQQQKERQPAQVSESRDQLNRFRFHQKNHNFWAWLGTGFSYVNYQQTVSDRGDLSSTSQNDSPGQYVEVGYIGDNGYGGVLGYKSTPGEVIVENVTLSPNTYVWRTISLEALSLGLSKYKIFGLPVIWGPRLGVQSHSVPFVYLNSSDQLELKQNEMITASLGVMADVPYERWKFHSYMRYQLPISASSGGSQGFELTPKVAFDGLLGTSYYFSQNFKMGAFWYGQWHLYDFVYTSSDTSNTGSQSLFYSTMDLRLGFEF